MAYFGPKIVAMLRKFVAADTSAFEKGKDNITYMGLQPGIWLDVRWWVIVSQPSVTQQGQEYRLNTDKVKNLDQMPLKKRSAEEE